MKIKNVKGIFFSVVAMAAAAKTLPVHDGQTQGGYFILDQSEAATFVIVSGVKHYVYSLPHTYVSTTIISLSLSKV